MNLCFVFMNICFGGIAWKVSFIDLTDRRREGKKKMPRHSPFFVLLIILFFIFSRSLLIMAFVGFTRFLFQGIFITVILALL